VSESMAEPGPQLAESPSPNRAAMRADAAAVLSWLQASVTWTLLDQMVTPLLGRSPLQITSGLFSAVIDLPDVTLGALGWLAMDHASWCMGESAEPDCLQDDERAALAALRGAVAGAFGL